MMRPMSEPAAPADDPAVFRNALLAAVAGFGLKPGPAQVEWMYRHHLLVAEANRHFNLTRITDPAKAAVRHYADSLSLLAAPWVDPGGPLAVLDVGTGAGFPAVPLALVCPAWSITAIDGTGKKARFVGQAAAALGLSNLVAMHVRVEELRSRRPAAFELVLVRAVGAMPDLLPIAAPLLRPGGRAVFYKTPSLPTQEMEAAARTAARCRLSSPRTFDLTLPCGGETLSRRLILFQR